MKKFPLYFSLLLLCGFLASCGITRRMAVRGPLHIVPDSMHLMANPETGIVHVNYQLEIPPKYAPRKSQVVFESELVSGENRLPVSVVYINGRTFERLRWRAAKFDDDVADYSDGTVVVSGREPVTLVTQAEFPFETWMSDAGLVATTGVRLCREGYLLERRVLARGVEYVPLAPGPVILPLEPVVKTPEIRKEEGYATLAYALNNYAVNPAYKDNAAELDKMAALLNKILKDSLLTTDKIVITGVCSPDGPYAYNRDLARNRARAVKNYLVTRLGVSPDLIHTDYIPEDWEGLRELVEQSDLPDKEEVLAIIDGTLSPEAKEAALKRMPQYPRIKSQMLPLLRRVQYEIYYTEKVWTEQRL